ncbi:hypothetical protein ES703_04491 [subsurface metagenome]
MKLGDTIRVCWSDIRHEDDLSLNEIKKLESAPAITYGKILVQNDSWITLASTEFPDENGTEYRGILCIPRCVISRIIKLKEV